MSRIKASALDGLEPDVLLCGTTDKLDVRCYHREWETDTVLKITTAYPTCICVHRPLFPSSDD